MQKDRDPRNEAFRSTLYRADFVYGSGMYS